MLTGVLEVPSDFDGPRKGFENDVRSVGDASRFRKQCGVGRDAFSAKAESESVCRGVSVDSWCIRSYWCIRSCWCIRSASSQHIIT